jgi:two-component system sensor histidine kinase VicK
MVFVHAIKLTLTLNHIVIHHPVDFAAYFLTAPPTLLLKPDAPRFTILDVNPAYLRAVNANYEDLVGLGTLEAFPENPLDPHTQNVSTLRNSLIRILQTKEQHILPSQKYDIPIRGTNEFETRYWKATNSPIVNGTGEVVYITHVVLDITQAIETAQKERFALELSEAKRKAIEQMEERLRLAIDSASLGTWYIDANTREFIVSTRFKELFGFGEHETITIDSALAQIDTAYHKKIIKGIEAAFSHRQIQDLEFPVVGCNDGQLRWLRSTGHLYAAQDDNRANFSGTIMDITKQKLDEQRKNDFIAMVSHELKTPLTSLNGYVQLLQTKIEIPGSGLVSNILGKAGRQVAKMISLIDGFLNVSRLEAGRINIQPAILDLALLIKEIEQDNEFSKSHDLIFNPIETTWVKVDRDKIELVITNLISNAVKYSPLYTSIQVSSKKTDDQKVIVSIRDQGIGVKPKDSAHLFDRFYRVENKQTASIAGFGIGLYICKEIIERHGGKIWLESEYETGSTFFFSLPLSHSN